MIPFPFQTGGLGFVAADQPGWTPAQISPTFWLNDASPITDNAGNCAQWNDISGNGKHFSRVSPANQPLIVSTGLNGRRTIRFDGLGDSLARAPDNLFQNSPACYCFIVLKKLATDAGSFRLVFVTQAGVNATRFSVSASATGFANRPRMVARRLDADAAGILGGATATGTDWYMVMCQMEWSSGAGTIYLNDVSDATNPTLTSAGNTSNTNNFSDILIGSDGTNHADVEIAEMVVTNGVILGTSDRNKLFGYAAHRWGLTSLLDISHPYKTTPP